MVVELLYVFFNLAGFSFVIDVAIATVIVQAVAILVAIVLAPVLHKFMFLLLGYFLAGFPLLLFNFFHEAKRSDVWASYFLAVGLECLVHSFFFLNFAGELETGQLDIEFIFVAFQFDLDLF